MGKCNSNVWPRMANLVGMKFSWEDMQIDIFRVCKLQLTYTRFEYICLMHVSNKDKYLTMHKTT